MGTPRISVSDHHINGLQYSGDESDSFIIDMNSFTGKNVPANPRISVSSTLHFGPTLFLLIFKTQLFS